MTDNNAFLNQVSIIEDSTTTLLTPEESQTTITDLKTTNQNPSLPKHNDHKEDNGTSVIPNSGTYANHLEAPIKSTVMIPLTQVPQEATKQQIAPQNIQVYACPNIESTSTMVGKLAKYYTELDQSAKHSEIVLHKNNELEYSHLASSTGAINIDRNHKNTSSIAQASPTSQEFDERLNELHSTSFEEIRQRFENKSKITGTAAQRKKTIIVQNHAVTVPRVSSTLEMHFVKGKSPLGGNKQTRAGLKSSLSPPSLPLPPPPDELEKNFREINSTEHQPKKHFSSNGHSIKPIISFHPPFRSQSLSRSLLPRSADSVNEKPKSFCMSTVTQPANFNVYDHNSVIFRPESARISHPTSFVKSPSSQPGRRYEAKSAIQPNTVWLVPADDSPTSNDDVIYVESKKSSALFRRTAVVYESVENHTKPGSPKHFITTYVISTGGSPKSETIRATNMWVAERALCTSENQSKMPPHRTQRLTRTDDTLQTYHQSMGQGHHSRSLSRNRVTRRLRTPRRYIERSNSPEQPPPLPSPPPRELHKYILRCSSGDELTQYRKAETDKTVHCDRRLDRSTSPMRSSWSVKSLSPPPFRTPCLTSLLSTRSSRSMISLDRNSLGRGSPDIITSRHRSYDAVDPHPKAYDKGDYRNYIETYHFERKRKRQERDRREWLHRAKDIGQERQNYHQLTGSWSPTHQHISTKCIPNNLEEQTESNIRNIIKQSPPPRSFVSPKRIQQSTNNMNVAVQWSTDEHKNNNRNGVDTTPITENFDKKLAFFENLTRRKMLSARCLYNPECYHCPNGHTPYDSYSSADSEALGRSLKMERSIARSNLRGNTCIARNEAKFIPSVQPLTENNKHKQYKVDMIREPIYGGPQQYSSSLYFASALPGPDNSSPSLYSTNRQNRDFISNRSSVEHEYYTKPIESMPKVAPNPPSNWQPRSYDEYPYDSEGSRERMPSYLRQSQAELVHSPRSIDEEKKWLYGGTMYKDLTTARGIHSPPCRFYGDVQINDSLESLHYVPSQAQGRVREIVSNFNQRVNNLYGSSGCIDAYGSYSTPDLRRSMRK